MKPSQSSNRTVSRRWPATAVCLTAVLLWLTGATPLQGRYGDRSPEAELLRTEALSRLLAAIPTLSVRQRRLVRGYYFEGRSLDAMAKDLGISKSWASRLHTQALRQLRAAVEPK